MLQSPTNVVLNQGNMGLKSYQYVSFNNPVKRNQYYEAVVETNDRSERSALSIQQVIHADMERMKTNKVYERELDQHLNGPTRLNWQCRQELQRLRSDERDSIRLNRDVAKISSSHSIVRSPSLPRNQTSRLSSIAEEDSHLPLIEKPKSVLGRSSSINANRTSVKHLFPIQKRSTMIKTNPYHEQSYLLPKYTFQQLIAKTSDDHARTINQQKRLIEQRLKLYLH